MSNKHWLLQLVIAESLALLESKKKMVKLVQVAK